MKNIIKKIAAFQQECPTIEKDTQGYGYKYASLPKIIETINPVLQKHGLGFTQPLIDRGIKTIVFDIESGETLESFVEIPEEKLSKMNAFQTMGSGVTYIRRYALSSILGIVTDEDTDAAGEPEKPKKEYLSQSHNRYEEIKLKVQSGTSVEVVKKHFDLSKEVEKEFKTIESKFKPIEGERV